MTELKMPAAEAKKTVAARVEPKPTMIRAVYGRMVDPHTGLVFDLAPCELFKMTPWVQCQVDAGKLVLI